jgi:hypothetical protein
MISHGYFYNNIGFKNSLDALITGKSRHFKIINWMRKFQRFEEDKISAPNTPIKKAIEGLYKVVSKDKLAFVKSLKLNRNYRLSGNWEDFFYDLMELDLITFSNPYEETDPEVSDTLKEAALAFGYESDPFFLAVKNDKMNEPNALAQAEEKVN